MAAFSSWSGRKRPPSRVAVGRSSAAWVRRILFIVFSYGDGSQGIGQQHINADDIDRQTGADAVLADIAGGFAHALVVGEQGLGALLGQCVKLLRLGSQKIEGSANFALHSLRRQVATGGAFQQACDRFIAQPLRVGTAHTSRYPITKTPC